MAPWALVLALAAPARAQDLSGLWVRNSACVEDPRAESCLDEHLVQVVQSGATIQAVYVRTSATFKRYGVGDGAHFLAGTLTGDGLSGTLYVYFPTSEDPCGLQGSPTSLTASLSPDGRQLGLRWQGLEIQRSSCTVRPSTSKSRTWFRVVESAQPQAGQSEIPGLLPMPSGSEECAAWVAYRDEVLPPLLDAATTQIEETHGAVQTMALLEKIEGELEELEQQGFSEQLRNAIARSLSQLSDRFMVLVGLAAKTSGNPAVQAGAEAVGTAYGRVKCTAVMARDILTDASLKQDLTDCIVGAYLDDQLEQRAMWGTRVLGSTATMVSDLTALKASDDGYRSALYRVQTDLAKVRNDMDRYQAEVDRAAEGWAQLRELDALREHIDEVCR